MRQVVDIAKKLELTSIALGCLTRKELCAAFARVNPNTAMTLQNSYNWQGGRSTPRSFALFEDWAAVLGLDEGAHFVMSSSLADFARRLGSRYPLPDNLLDAFDGSSSPAPAGPVASGKAGAAAAWRNGALLRGSFMALSLAFSPLQRGRALRGAITLDTDGAGNVAVTYLENVLGQKVPFRGSGLEDGRTGQVALQCEANGGTFLMAFHLPPLPGNLAGGVFAGNAIYDPNSEPTASTLLFIRNHELSQPDLEELAGYDDLSDTVLAGCLDRLGYGRDPAHRAERELAQLLLGSDTAPLLSMARDSMAHAAALLDQRRLKATGLG